MNHSQSKCFRALMQIACVVSLMLVALRGGAQSVESSNESTSPTLVAPAQGHKSVPPELRLWRSLTLSQGTTHHDYREPDPLGRVNPLNSETGSIPTTEMTLRWRGQLAGALPELVVQAQVGYAQGQTDYNGYLQQGVTLTPYGARTGNTMQALRLRVGLPLNALIEQPWAQHIAPYAEQSWHRWHRNLVQYGETFDWQARTFGLMMVWPLAGSGLPQLTPLNLEVDLATGRSNNSRMAAPTFGFAADLGETDKQNASLTLRYAVTSTWLLGLGYAAQWSKLGPSSNVSGLQFPGAHYKSQGLSVSVGAHY